MSGIYETEEAFIEQGFTLAESLGIRAEPSGAAGLSLLLQLRDRIPADKKILIVNTGKLRFTEAP